MPNKGIWKIVFHLDGRGVVYNPMEPIHLDGLIEYAVASQRHLNYLEPLKSDNKIKELDLPLQWKIIHGEKVWKASAIQPIGKVIYEKRYLRKRFDPVRADGLTKGAINITTGPYRSYNNSVNLVLCRKMEAWFHGNKKSIQKLLKDIKQLGKKRASGFGRILEKEYIEVENDFSLVRNGKTQRFIPDPEGIRFQRARPPYWSNIGRVNHLPVGWPISEELYEYLYR